MKTKVKNERVINDYYRSWFADALKAAAAAAAAVDITISKNK